MGRPSGDPPTFGHERQAPGKATKRPHMSPTEEPRRRRRALEHEIPLVADVEEGTLPPTTPPVLPPPPKPNLKHGKGAVRNVQPN
jgi:hypothetical protein